jgi:pyruvate/2-oxoglutarate dehydrogenase complex dihydrolipoamide acyltransferase (E2) component
VAVATPKGLVTPVVRNAEGMGFVEIEKEIGDLGKKVRCTAKQLTGNTLTGHVLGPGWEAGIGRHGRRHVYHVSLGFRSQLSLF